MDGDDRRLGLTKGRGWRDSSMVLLQRTGPSPPAPTWWFIIVTLVPGSNTSPDLKAPKCTHAHI